MSSSTVDSILESIRRRGFVTCRASAIDDSLIADSLRIVRADYAPLSSALDNKRIPWHNEQLYSTTPPSFVCLICRQIGDGGRTLLLDAADAAVRLTEIRALEGVVLRHRKRERSATHALICRHPTTGVRVLSYREGRSEDLAITAAPRGVEKHWLRGYVTSSLQLMHDSVYAHSWTPGEVLIIDNYRCLHAREAYTGERQMERILLWSQPECEDAPHVRSRTP